MIKNICKDCMAVVTIQKSKNEQNPPVIQKKKTLCKKCYAKRMKVLYESSKASSLHSKDSSYESF